MKHSAYLIALTILVSACQAKTPAENPVQRTEESSSMEIENILPEGFLVMSKVKSSSGQICVSGAQMSDDGVERAKIFNFDGKSARPLWELDITLDRDFYQNRATHCFCHESACYVLVATDTQSEQSLSQTLLSVAKLSAQDGTIFGVKSLEKFSGSEGPVTAWVEPSPENFSMQGNQVLILGKFRSLNNNNDQAFKISIDADFTKGNGQ